MPRNATEVVIKVARTFRVLSYAGALLLATPSYAFAEESITLLGVDSEDAEEEATVITQSLQKALEERGALAPKTSSSFTTLSALARCPPRPDVPCLKRISKLIKLEAFIWGLVRKDDAGIAVELHRFDGEGGPIDVQKIKQAAAFNAKEAAAKLLGDHANATINITCPVDDDVVWIDEHARTVIRKGRASTTVTANESHALEVRRAGKVVHKATVTPQPPATSWSCPETASESIAGPAPAASSRTSSGRIAGYTMIGASALAATVATIFAVKYAKNVSATDEARAYIPRSITDVCAATMAGPRAEVACSEYQAANASRAAAITAGFIGVAFLSAGLYFSFRNESTQTTITPSVSKDQVGASFTVNF